jgi:Holliday junction resolvase-like predicted endonuclease
MSRSQAPLARIRGVVTIRGSPPARRAPLARAARRQHGSTAERIAERYLVQLGWEVVGRNLRVARDEIDIVGVEPGTLAIPGTPGTPETLVFVEVRSSATGRFGSPEESVVGGKLRRTYRAAWEFLRNGASVSPGRRPTWRVDVVIVEQRPNLGRDIGGPVIRHLRGVAPE